MKKLIFALAAIALAACSNEETIERNRTEAISFDKVFVDNSTRSVVDPSFTSTGTTPNMFSDFAVFGFVTTTDATTTATAPIFTNETVTGSGSTWTYSGTTQYWIAGANYNFAAVAPKTDGNWTDPQATVEGTSLSFTNNGTTDLLYDQTTTITGKVSGNATVGFSFRHTLSKVKFSFQNSYNATNTTIAVNNIKITDAYSTANVALTATATTWSQQAGTLLLEFGNASVAGATTVEEIAQNATAESYKELFLIPEADDTKTYTVEFDVDLYVGGVKIKTFQHRGQYATTLAFNPVAGTSYDINAIITPANIDPTTPEGEEQEPIQFTVTEIKTWTPAEVDDIIEVEEDDDNN